MISNATCIIYLSRLNQLELLRRLYKIVVITPLVKDEILIADKPGYNQINDAIGKGLLIIEKPKNIKDFGLDAGENEAINLALEKRAGIILDDYAARVIAKSLGLETIRTTTLLFNALFKKIISKKQAISLLNQMIDSGYYIAPAEYAALLTKLMMQK